MTKNDETFVVIAHMLWMSLHLLTAVISLSVGIRFGTPWMWILGGIGTLLSGGEILMTVAVAVGTKSKEAFSEWLTEADFGIIQSAVDYGTETETKESA